MVAKPATLALDELRSLPRHEVTSTLECSGNNGLPFATSTIGNARWAGASLAETLRAAQIKRGAFEVVFYGVEQGEGRCTRIRRSNSSSPAISRAACRSTMR
jgi:DMSO/TMAO reductase YedYZ molybdopterin-dependent catalytic subunit